MIKLIGIILLCSLFIVYAVYKDLKIECNRLYKILESKLDKNKYPEIFKSIQNEKNLFVRKYTLTCMIGIVDKHSV